MNRHNLENKCSWHFYSDSICYFQRIHQRTKYINVSEGRKIFTIRWRHMYCTCYEKACILLWGINSNSMTWKCDYAHNITSGNYIMFVQFKKLNGMSHVCSSFMHFRSSVHIRFIAMTLRYWRWSAPGANGLRISGISHNWHICLRR